jgi:hypothetical protein
MLRNLPRQLLVCFGLKRDAPERLVRQTGAGNEGTRNGWLAVPLLHLLDEFFQCCLVSDQHCRTAQFKYVLPFQISKQARNRFT